jgi:prephenate dehydratase
VPCARSLEVFDRVTRGAVDGAVIPIENSLAGSVAEHFDLLLGRDVHIVREFRLRIVHNLIALPGTRLETSGACSRILSRSISAATCLPKIRS